MKKYLLTTFLLINTLLFGQTIMEEGFENGNTDGNSPTGWICDADGWVCGQFEKERNRKAHSGDWYAYATYNRDKWMYKAIDCQANSYYRISFWHITSGIGTFNLEVKGGTASNPTAMTNSIVAPLSLNNNVYQNVTAVFQVPISGTYYIGFHAYADNAPWYLTIDDVVIETSDLYNFSIEALTADTMAYMGELCPLRFLITNTGAEEETINLEALGDDFDEITFAYNNNTITNITIPSGGTAIVTANAMIPISGIQHNTISTLTINASSSHNNVSHQITFDVTILQPECQFPLTEGFDGEVFPPQGWKAQVISGTYNFRRLTAGSEPVCVPHDQSAAMAEYHSFSAHQGESAILVSPKLQFNDTENMVRFWMYRTDNINNREDKINIYYAPTATLEEASLLGTIHRCIVFSPEEDHNDWYEYNYTFDSPYQYGFIIFEAVSAYGWNMYLDDIFISNNTSDTNAPVVVSLTGNQRYADQEMMLTLRLYDQSEMPNTIQGTYVINGISHNVTMQKNAKGNNDYIATIPGQPNHTAGEISFSLIDALGNSAISDTYPLNWDWIAPILEEGFEGEQFPPEGWSRDGAGQSWFTWFRVGELFYTDSDGVEYIVTPPQGLKQASLEWDYTEEGGLQDESLITPIISITRPSVLTFKTFCHYGQPYHDRFAVRVLNTTQGVWENVWEASTLPMGINQYETPIQIDLTPYLGQNIKLSWRGYNTDASNIWYSWFIDDVKVIPTDTIPTILNDMRIRGTIYPNPTQNIVTIKNKDKIQQIRIYNILGVKQKEYYINKENEVSIEIEDLPCGLYLMEISSDESRWSSTIIKQ